MYSLFDYFLMVCELVSTLIYIFVVFKIIHSGLPIFRNGFFLIFISCSIADITSSLVNAALRQIITYMDDSLEMGATTFSIVYKILYCLSIHALSSNVLFSLFISANRSTAVGWPASHTTLWRTRNTLIAIAVVQFGLIPMYMQVVWSSDPVNVTENGDLKFIDLESDLLSRIHFTGAVFFVIRSILCLLMSIYTLRKLLKMTSRRSSTGARVSDTERKLCLHGIILFCGSMVMVAQQGIMFLAAWTNDLILAMWIANQFSLINDVVIYTNLYSIIICSSHVRSFFGSWTRKRTAHNTVPLTTQQTGFVMSIYSIRKQNDQIKRHIPEVES